MRKRTIENRAVSNVICARAAQNVANVLAIAAHAGIIVKTWMTPPQVSILRSCRHQLLYRPMKIMPLKGQRASPVPAALKLRMMKILLPPNN
jgi:hypothetical protein